MAIALLAVAFGGPRLFEHAGGVHGGARGAVVATGTGMAAGAGTAAGAGGKAGTSALATQISDALNRSYVPRTPWSARAAAILKSLPCLIAPSDLHAMVAYADRLGATRTRDAAICRRFGGRSGGG